MTRSAKKKKKKIPVGKESKRNFSNNPENCVNRYVNVYKKEKSCYNKVLESFIAQMPATVIATCVYFIISHCYLKASMNCANA